MYRGKACTYLNIKKQQDSRGRSSARGLNIGEGKLSVVRLTLIRLPLATLVVLTSTERLHFSCVWMLYIYIYISLSPVVKEKLSNGLMQSITFTVVQYVILYLLKQRAYTFIISVSLRKGNEVCKEIGDLLVWVSVCVRNVCLHLCFSYYRLGSPWDIEGQPIRRSHAGGKSLNGSYNIALFKTLGSSFCFAIYLFCNLTCQ